MSLINRFPSAATRSLQAFDPWMNMLQRPSLFDSPPLGMIAAEQLQVPAFDLRETPREFLLSADVPGYSKEQISIDCEGQVINVRGSWTGKKEEENVKEGYWFRERARSSFQRSINLSSPFDANKITAELNHGVLEINVPKMNGGQASKKVFIK